MFTSMIKSKLYQTFQPLQHPSAFFSLCVWWKNSWSCCVNETHQQQVSRAALESFVWPELKLPYFIKGIKSSHSSEASSIWCNLMSSTTTNKNRQGQKGTIGERRDLWETKIKCKIQKVKVSQVSKNKRFIHLKTFLNKYISWQLIFLPFFPYLFDSACVLTK